ncbi:MAG: M15 family metallopeptidase [Armatimonadota bacterium]
MSASKKGLNAQFVKKLGLFEKALAEHGIAAVMTSGYRSIADQNALYAKGRSVAGSVVTKARGGYSWHNFGLAADYAFVVSGKITWEGPWASFGKIAKECGLEWGGDFKTILDRPHVQWTAGNTLAQMRSSVKKGKATC